ncbi:hypothetical protein CEXT_458821 [Caerostris extrusa]|uniref:EGF-like domain-containing protein n=1 Tax=Caerostris extrusa TaxID=172846 RepID=A0AAV4XW45_CAEEX|nr:hypothetical protein CEXT_458821 [Caerostris extrusa]
MKSQTVIRLQKNIQGLDSNKYPLNSVQLLEETPINDPESLLSLSTRSTRQISQQSISGADHNTLRPIILQLEKPDGIKQIESADRLSKLISKCTSDLQCSADATCIRQDPVENGFCRCTKGFQGNGIFCWGKKSNPDLQHSRLGIDEAEALREI